MAGERWYVACSLQRQEGQVVRVVAGPFASAVGCLERLNATGRVRVLLDIMGGKVPTLLDRSSLQAA